MVLKAEIAWQVSAMPSAQAASTENTKQYL